MLFVTWLLLSLGTKQKTPTTVLDRDRRMRYIGMFSTLYVLPYGVARECIGLITCALPLLITLTISLYDLGVNTLAALLRRCDGSRCCKPLLASDDFVSCGYVKAKQFC